VSASHSISRAQQPTVTPRPTVRESTAIHLISSGATFLSTPFGMAVQTPPHNDSVVYLRQGKCHIAQHQTEYILQHVGNIRKFDTKYSDIQPLGSILNTVSHLTGATFTHPPRGPASLCCNTPLGVGLRWLCSIYLSTR